MTRLTNPVTGHELTADDAAAVDFWTAAGYRESKPAAKKAPAKKTSAKKSK